MKNDNNINVSEIDYRSFTPAEWQAFKQAIIARAHQERAVLMRAEIRALFGWLDRVVERVLKAVFTPKLPAPPSHRA